MGFEVISRDGEKIGKIKDLISDHELSSQYLVIKHSLLHDLVVPADAAEKRGGTVVVPFTRPVLDGAPRVAKGPLSGEDARRLDDFYRTRAA
jgi:ribosomal 30S subunit maturation factor RimM